MMVIEIFQSRTFPGLRYFYYKLFWVEISTQSKKYINDHVLATI